MIPQKFKFFEGTRSVPYRVKCALNAQNWFYELFSRFWTEYIGDIWHRNNQASGRKQGGFLFVILCAVFLYPANFAVQAQNLISSAPRRKSAEKAEKLTAAAAMKQAISEVISGAVVLEPRKIFELNLAKRERLLREDEKNFYRERLKQKLLEAKVSEFGLSTSADGQNEDRSVPKARLNQEVARIRAEISDVLKIYRREIYTEILYYESPEPAIFLYAEFIIVVTSAARKVLTAEELQAAAAHELAHECFAAEMIGAQTANDYERQRKIEYKCDSVGVLALELIGKKSCLFYQAAKKLEESEQEFAAKYNLKASTRDTHPPIKHRKQAVRIFMNGFSN